MTIFTRRHYIWLEEQFAAALRQTHYKDRGVIFSTIDQFADSLERQSIGFDKALFIEEIHRLWQPPCNSFRGKPECYIDYDEFRCSKSTCKSQPM